MSQAQQKIGPDNILARNPDLMWSEVDGEIVLLDADSGSYFSFDRVASDIWRQIAEPLAVRTIVDRLCQTYDAPCAVIEADAMRFLDHAVSRNVILVEG